MRAAYLLGLAVTLCVPMSAAGAFPLRAVERYAAPAPFQRDYQPLGVHVTRSAGWRQAQRRKRRRRGTQ